MAGFTVESYGWLQQDNSAVSVQLLAQISAQLGSFTASPGFINSTVAPCPLTIFDGPFTPAQLDVRINTLWFLSLAVSLTASLLAIIVQQWLREYRLPGHVPARERVRLRQYRYDSLCTWGVPQIVSTLPILLQAALVLFLAGLCYLLASIDETVAKVFIAFVGVSMTAYFCFTVLPVAFRRCPYKNSIAHVLIQVVKLVYVVGWLIAACFLITLLVTSLFLLLLYRKMTSSTRTMAMPWPLPAPKETGSAQFALSGHEYWTARDLDAIREPAARHLDARALVWAPSALSHTEVVRMHRCLRELQPHERAVCVCAWVGHVLNIHPASLFSGLKGQFREFDRAALAKIDSTFSDHFRHILLYAVPPVLACTLDWKTAHHASVLLILRHIARLKPADSQWTREYAQLVIKTRDAQVTDHRKGSAACWGRLPMGCLFELSTIVEYDFSAGGAWARRPFSLSCLIIVPLPPRRDLEPHGLRQPRLQSICCL